MLCFQLCGTFPMTTCRNSLLSRLHQVVFQEDLRPPVRGRGGEREGTEGEGTISNPLPYTLPRIITTLHLWAAALRVAQLLLI
jgi:hypothetical protein